MMTADDLISLAATRGIDLTHVAGVASKIDGAAAPRRLTRGERKDRQEKHLGLEVLDTVKGTETRVYKRPQWSIQELGMAAKGCDETPWRAVLYAQAGAAEGENWAHLFWRLAEYADERGKREKWPTTILRLDKSHRPYVHELIALVLYEQGELRPYFVGAPALRAICGAAYLNVTDHQWRRVLAEKHEAISQRYEGWLAKARSLVNAWMRGGPEIKRLQEFLSKLERPPKSEAKA